MTGSGADTDTRPAVQIARMAEALSPRAGVAMRVLSLVDDPEAGAADLAAAIAADPALAGHVMRVANSSYYGLSGRVGNLQFAVSAIGFRAVRGVAAAAAVGLEDPGAIPEGFWEAAATVAVLCESVAGRLGADPGDAFSIGLLHLVGSAALHRMGPPVPLCMPCEDDGVGLLAAETERFGDDHAAVGGALLARWKLPERLWSIIARHHEQPLPDAPPLERTLRVARLLANRCLTTSGSGPPSDGPTGEPGDGAERGPGDGATGEPGNGPAGGPYDGPDAGPVVGLVEGPSEGLSKRSDAGPGDGAASRPAPLPPAQGGSPEQGPASRPPTEPAAEDTAASDIGWLTDGVLGAADLPALVALGRQQGAALLRGLRG